MNDATKTALDNFVNLVQGMIDAGHAQNFPTLPRTIVRVDLGRRYAKLVTTSLSRSVFCFVDLDNGDILKAATWKAPAKHARGNIFAENPLDGVNPYGANYLV